MAELYFPQLSSGAMVQYPIQKSRLGRTIRNMLLDGSVVLHPDPDAGRIIWQMRYVGLSQEDLSAITSHFRLCEGRLRAFTFLDPVENLLDNSVDFGASGWRTSRTIDLVGGIADPASRSGAFVASNNGQSDAEIKQDLSIPAGYRYCFSVYALSDQSAKLTLIRRGSHGEEAQSYDIGPRWSRLVSSGQLTDSGSGFSVALSLAPGQRISLFGPQLEAQIAPSRYRGTWGAGGVYPFAHWAMNDLAVSSDGPDCFSTELSIETASR